MDYDIHRFESFANAYRKGLTKAMLKYPDEYMPGLTAEQIADRMIAKISDRGIGSVVVAQSKGFKYACQELGIKQTYKGITKYLTNGAGK